MFAVLFGLVYRFLLAPLVIPFCAVFGLQLLLHQNFGVSLPGWGMWLAFFFIAFLTGYFPWMGLPEKPLAGKI